MKLGLARTASHALLALVFAFSAAAPATANTPSAIEIVKKMEQTISGYDDQTMDVKMTVTDVDGSSKSYEFTIHEKDTKRLIRFTSGEIKGMATLIEGRGRVHVYLPGYKKVRRVASHAMNQSFAGSDFTNDDMSSVNWSNLYDVKILKEDDSNWHLDCHAKEGVKVVYGRVVLKVARKDFQQSGIIYYGRDGKKIKTMENSRPKKYDNGIIRNSVVAMTDARTGHSTRLDVKDFQVNQGLRDSKFSVRELQWGR